MISVIQTKLNLGSLSSFDGELLDVTDEHHTRNINHQRPHVIGKFPLLFSDSRLRDSLEINLFLQHSYKGLFLRPFKRGQKNLLGGVTVKTIKSIANSLKVFLVWLEAAEIEWKDLYAASASEKPKECLPPYRFRAHLTERIKRNELSLNTANLHVSHVRQLYEWGILMSCIQCTTVF
jgi:hypothetical protein